MDARTNPEVSIRQGGTMFLIPHDTPGFRVGKVFNKRGWRFYQNAELIFENARVPHANVVGEVNGGASARGGGPPQFGDLELAANALGVCGAAVEMAMQYARTRRQGDKRIIDQQLIQLKLAEMHMLTEALRSYVMRTAWERDRALLRDERAREFQPATFVCTYSRTVIDRVTSLNMDIHAAAGPRMNAGADKLARDAMVWTHLAGDTVQRLRAIRHLIK